MVNIIEALYGRPLRASVFIFSFVEIISFKL